MDGVRRSEVLSDICSEWFTIYFKVRTEKNFEKVPLSFDAAQVCLEQSFFIFSAHIHLEYIRMT